MKRPYKILHGLFVNDKEKSFITLMSREKVIKLFLSMIDRFACYARVFDRLDWKSLPMTNTLDY
jgi:hypothetical protein